MIRPFILALWVGLAPLATARALDTFERHNAYWLSQAMQNTEPLKELSSRQAAGLKLLGPDITSPCLAVRTSEGHVAKLQVSWAFRKADPKPVPVLVLERFVTYDRDKPNIAVASGKNVMLFPGFQFDLDIGQVVPADSGADLMFNEQRRLLPVGNAALHGLNGSALPPEDAQDPASHAGVAPKDFAGTWDVDADGRLKGVWTLSVDDEGNVDGQHLATESQSTFPITGRVTDGNRLLVEVQFAVATQSFDLYLWTSDKAKMAGSTVFTDRKFGVVAMRRPKKDAAAESSPGKSP